MTTPRSSRSATSRTSCSRTTPGRSCTTSARPGSPTRPASESVPARSRPDSCGRSATAARLVLAHPTGYAEVWYGEVEGARITLATDLVARTSTAKEYTAGQRMYGLVEGDLMYAYDMAAEGHEMQSHLWGRLQRV
ncbi:FABP family protein [Aeromicrobium sp. UC242_57]|uniref:FABP family protein n=1 Tax=Aeromicrobium sp. UC242_57 TaxID=3374624 RepID=UPI0037B50724